MLDRKRFLKNVEVIPCMLQRGIIVVIDIVSKGFKERENRRAFVPRRNHGC